MIPALRHLRRSRLAIGLCAAVFFVLPGAAFSQAGSSPRVILPQYGDNGAADTLYYFDLGNGSGAMVDQLRRDADRGRVSQLKTNLFREIGRSTEQPAGVGEIFLGPLRGSDGQVRAALFVEASTGYTVYFDQLGKGGALGRVTTMIKRGFESVASRDTNFALLMRRNGSGRTEGAYLYHATTGNASYLGGLDELEIDPPVTAVGKLPALAGQVSAAPIVVSEETVSYLVLDNPSGKVYFFDVSENVGRLTVRTTDLSLASAFPAETLNPSPQRFMAVPLQNDGITTYAVLIVDVGTGGLGLLDGLREPQPRLGALSRNLYTVIPGGLSTSSRSFAVVDANDADGTTRGAWIFDSLSGGFFYVESPGDPGSTTVRPMRLER